MTGGSGFIGGRLACALLDAGLRVRVLSRAPSQLAGRAAPEIFIGDLRDEASLAGIEEGVTHVFHAAALLGTWGTPDADLVEVNVRGTARLLARFSSSSSLRQFVHVSAGGVTGPMDHVPADEETPCRPVTAYERTKYEAELLALSRAADMGIPLVVARPTFTYGPGDPHKLPLFRAVRRGHMVFLDGGMSVNHPAYIDDVIEGLLLVSSRGRNRDVYIIGGTRPVSKREFVFAIADALGAPRPRVSIPSWAARPAARGMEALGSVLGFEPILTTSRVLMMSGNFGYSIEKAVREVGFLPRTDITKGIHDTVDYYRRRNLI